MSDIKTETPITVSADDLKLVTVEPRSGAPDIRKFSGSALNAKVEQYLSALKPNESMVGFAFVEKHGDTTEAHFAIAGKVPKLPGKAEWTIYHVQKWDKDGHDATTGAAFRWGI